jgi:hypothetical protein
VVRKPGFFDDSANEGLPKHPLAGSDFEVADQSEIWLTQIKTSDLARFKDAFLSKNIKFGAGMWAFAVIVDGYTVGFLEFSNANYDHRYVYMMSDFAVPGTRYKRLSKLVVMLAIAAETKRLIERLRVKRTRALATTAFTPRPVSMKYRGVLDLAKRGETADGQKFLNYQGEFNDLSWQDTLKLWQKKHGSKVW